MQIVENTASWMRRMVALVVDWAACSLISLLVLGPHGYSDKAWSGWLTLGIFWVETSLGVALVGGSFGQLATKLRVLRLDGRPVPLILALARQLLVCVVIPPLVFRPDGRGLHDLAVDSATYDLRKIA